MNFAEKFLTIIRNNSRSNHFLISELKSIGDLDRLLSDYELENIGKHSEGRYFEYLYIISLKFASLATYITLDTYTGVYSSFPMFMLRMWKNLEGKSLGDTAFNNLLRLIRK